MFLPLALRDHIRSVQLPAADGGMAPLVKSEQTLFLSTAPSPPDAPPRWLHWYLGIGLAVGGLAALLGWRSRHQSTARVALALLLIAWGMVVGLAGSVLSGMWAFTDHVMAYRNENLFQVNPLAWLMAFAGALALLRPRRATRLTLGAAYTLAGLALIGFVLQALAGIRSGQRADHRPGPADTPRGRCGVDLAARADGTI